MRSKALSRWGAWATSGFVIHPAVGVKDFREMVAYAKQHPGKLAYGSAGLGTATQLRVEMLKYRAGIDILHSARSLPRQRRRAQRSVAQHSCWLPPARPRTSWPSSIPR